MLIDVFDERKTYKCIYCQYERNAPEIEDRNNLSDEDYVLVQVLLSIYQHFINVDDSVSREVVYSSIDKIRRYKGKKEYSFANCKGEYLSPIKHTALQNDNEYFVDISLTDTTVFDKKMELYLDMLVYGGKILVDGITLALPPTFFGVSLGILWSGISEYAITLYENYKIYGYHEYDISSVLVSSTLTIFDGLMDNDAMTSAVNMTYSLYNQINIALQEFDYIPSHKYRNYSAGFRFYNETNEMWCIIKLKNIDVNDLCYTRYNKFDSTYDSRDCSGSLRYRNAVSICVEDYNGFKTKNIFGIMGDCYLEQDIDDNWNEIDERTGRKRYAE